MPWAARFGASLALVSLVELLLAEVLPAAGRTIDLFVLLVILSSLAGNSLQGVIGGLAAGLVQDTLSASPFGLHALACCVVGYGVARLSQRIVTSQRLVASLLVGHIVGAILDDDERAALLEIAEMAASPPGSEGSE